MHLTVISARKEKIFACLFVLLVRISSQPSWLALCGSIIKRIKSLACDVFDTFSDISTLLMASRMHPTGHKMAELTVMFSRLSNVFCLFIKLLIYYYLTPVKDCCVCVTYIKYTVPCACFIYLLRLSI